MIWLFTKYKKKVLPRELSRVDWRNSSEPSTEIIPKLLIWPLGGYVSSPHVKKNETSTNLNVATQFLEWIAPFVIWLMSSRGESECNRCNSISGRHFVNSACCRAISFGRISNHTLRRLIAFHQASITHRLDVRHSPICAGMRDFTSWASFSFR